MRELDLLSATIAVRGSNSRMRQAFRSFDDDETGAVTFDNLKRVALDLGEDMTDDELKDMLREIDKGARCSLCGVCSPRVLLTLLSRCCEWIMNDMVASLL